ncbi:hypothetical protein ABZ079_02785 [Streptomyces sp. NPDC006314]|uniref:hypothetical protein n=1 Tax=Streptomyces sp. NPDC006314 TaxID=3154475 RepID=UPI00339F6914
MTTRERTGFGADAAEAILRRASAFADVDPDGVEILRPGDHAVFRVDGGRIISRVGRGADRLASVRVPARFSHSMAKDVQAAYERLGLSLSSGHLQSQETTNETTGARRSPSTVAVTDVWAGFRPDGPGFNAPWDGHDDT